MDSEWDVLDEGMEKEKLWMESIEWTRDCKTLPYSTSYALSMVVEVKQDDQME